MLLVDSICMACFLGSAPFKTVSALAMWHVLLEDHLRILDLKLFGFSRNHYYTSWDLGFLFSKEEAWSLFAEDKIRFHHFFLFLHIIVTYIIEYASPWVRWLIYVYLDRLIQAFVTEYKYRKVRKMEEFELRRLFFLANMREVDHGRAYKGVYRRKRDWEKELYWSYQRFEKFRLSGLSLLKIILVEKLGTSFY